MTENEIEAAVQATNPAGLRITPEDIDALIAEEAYYVFPGTTMTVCCLTTTTRSYVVGYSACISPENFDAAIGRQIARSEARDKLWELEGYAAHR